MDECFQDRPCILRTYMLNKHHFKVKALNKSGGLTATPGYHWPHALGQFSLLQWASASSSIKGRERVKCPSGLICSDAKILVLLDKTQDSRTV